MVAIHRFGYGKGFEALNVTKEYLGGKGFGLVKMVQSGLPIPPGLIIPTHNSQTFMQLPEGQQEDWLVDVLGEVWEHLKDLKAHMGHMPLLSVRSGAPVSMPGMMDTILNVGITDGPKGNLGEWAVRFGDNAQGDWIAMDCQRRLIQMLGSTAFGVPHGQFEAVLHNLKDELSVKDDKDIPLSGLDTLVKRYKKVFQAVVQKPFPNTVEEQLLHAIRAVFESWSNPRAQSYRKLNDIPDDMGTAVVIQSMVFGNMGEDSGTGVLFSRCPMTGDNKIMGEFLTNAQGEDVVAGIRTPVPFDEMAKMNGKYAEHWSVVHAELEELCEELENHTYNDMVDIEFTVQQGKLYVLQSRVGKRSALAAFVIAKACVDEGLITVEEAFQRVTQDQFKIVSRPVVPPHFKEPEAGKGIPASPGVAKGIAVFTSEAAVASQKHGIDCILVTKETTPDDIDGMYAAKGILTTTGGATSHAAVVARAMDKPCVVGCSDLKLVGADMYGLGGKVIENGTKVCIDGASGRIWIDTEVEVVDASSHSAIQQFLSWSVPPSSIDILTTAIPDGSYAIEVARLAKAKDYGSDQLEAIVAAVKAGHTIILDATERKGMYDPQDDALWECFGPDMSYEVGVGGVFGWLASQLKADAAKIIVLDPDPKFEAEIAKSGFMVVGPAKTLNEYLTNPFATMNAAFEQNVLGGEEAQKVVAKLVADLGITKAVVPQMIQRRNALFKKAKA